jgi:hypothetical protein
LLNFKKKRRTNIKAEQDLIHLCHKVCAEFQANNVNQDIDPRTLKESYNLRKQPNGLWFKSTKLGLHDGPVLTPIDFTSFPSLKKLIDFIDDVDSEIKKKGGRIFITKNQVTKIIKGCETPILVSENKNTIGKFSMLCLEIVNHGLENNRYRTEETYMLTKSASGEWSMNIGHDNHSGIKKILNIKAMPLLEALTNKINKIDPQFHSNGGRIFITPSRVYRIKNKFELDFKL